MRVMPVVSASPRSAGRIVLALLFVWPAIVFMGGLFVWGVWDSVSTDPDGAIAVGGPLFAAVALFLFAAGAIWLARLVRAGGRAARHVMSGPARPTRVEDAPVR